MTRKDTNRSASEIKAMMAGDGEFLRPMVKAVIQSFWKRRWRRPSERKKGERTEGRLSYRAATTPAAWLPE